MKESKLRALFLVISIFIVILNLGLLILALNNANIINVEKPTAKIAYLYGEIKMCANPAIELEPINTTCGDNFTLHTNESFFCVLNYSQIDTDNISFSSQFMTPPPNVFQIQENGIINFTTKTNSWGNHSAIITAIETGGECNVYQTSDYVYNFTIHFNNTPPEYYRTLPNVTMDRYDATIPFYLGDYFRDIDEQHLNYEALGYNIGALDIIIFSDTSEVLIRTMSPCGNYTVFFLAEDPYFDHAISSPPTNVEILCGDFNPNVLPSEEADGSGSGAGGGESSTCVENWECMSWSDCYAPIDRYPDYINGYKKRDCYDQNACDPDNYKTTIFKDCNYTTASGCYPDWDCREWTPCRKDGTQERICLDKNECPIEDQNRFGIPDTIKLCTYSESCSDGIRNNNELGIDCGGPCEPCKTVELPSIINNISKVLAWVIGISIGLIIIIIIIFQIFKKQIRKFISKVIWFFVKKASRQLYLFGKQKKKIVKMILDYEEKLIENIEKNNLISGDFEKLESKLYILSRTIFGEILEINPESSKQEFIDKINLLDTTEEFRKMILGIVNRMLQLESKGRKVINSQLNEIILDFNTLKFLTFSISDRVNRKEFSEILFEDSELNMVVHLLRTINRAYIDLQHKRIDEAKQKYLSSIELYESLDEKTKTKVYELTSELFNTITYVSSHIV